MGFAEGSKTSWLAYRKLRYQRNMFVIYSSDLKGLERVQYVLVCGRIESAGKDSYKFTISDQVGTFKLINIFNGNLFLDRNKVQFIRYLENFNELKKPYFRHKYKYYIEYKDNTHLPSFKNAWLSGYMAARGSFDVGFDSQGVGLYVNFILEDQDLKILKSISKLFLKSSFDYKYIKKKYKKVIVFTNRLYINVLEEVLRCLHYLRVYPMHSNKVLSLIDIHKMFMDRFLNDVTYQEFHDMTGRYLWLVLIVNELNSHKDVNFLSDDILKRFEEKIYK